MGEPNEKGRVIPLSAMNIFENASLILFYQVREVLAKYTDSYSVIDKREIALDTAEVLEAFLKFNFNDAEIELFDELLRKLKYSKDSKTNDKKQKKDDLASKIASWFNTPEANITESKEQPNSDNPKFKGVLKLLKGISPEGVKLLDISRDIDLKGLKKHYKDAARKHHPDLGGSVEAMQVINNSYSLFHDAVLNFRPAGEERAKPIFWPENLRELEFSIRTVLASIYGDFYAADYAFEHVEKNEVLFNQIKEKSVGYFLNSIEDINRVISNPCRALGRMDMRNELKKAASFAHLMSETYIKYWVPQYEHERGYSDYESEDEIISSKPDMTWMPSRESMLMEAGVKLVINHSEQAKNAYRLGVIDEKRYQKTMKRYKVREEETESIINAIKDFIQSNRLQLKLSNQDYSLPDRKPTVVTPLDFFTLRYDKMEEDQKYEYLKNYTGQNVSSKILKYKKIRAMELLCGMIYGYDNLEHSKISDELSFFSKLDGYEAFELVKEFYDHLKGLSNSERTKKLKILSELDDPDYEPSFSIVIEITLDGSIKSGDSENVMVVDLTHDYIEFAKSPLKTIEGYLKTGNYTTDYKESWNADMAALNKFENSAVAKQRDKVWLKMHNPAPEKVIDSHKPYIEGLLKLGESFHPKNTGELQVGYSINKLTAAYGKIKDWDSVKYWLDLYFNLPKSYHDRASKGEIETMKKRLVRANKLLK